MNPFFFGSRRRLLFGIYHPPTGRPVEPAGIVLCPPLALEYMRGYRQLRQLAIQLSGRGFHVFRFDYHGTGDSGGTSGQETLGGWRRDVETAIQELRDLSGVTRITLIGVRFGAILAARAAASTRNLEELVFWQPTVTGRAHLDWMLDRAKVKGRRRTRITGPTTDPAGELETIAVDGFPLSLRLLREIGTTDLASRSIGELRAQRMVVIAPSGEEASTLVAALQEADMPHLHREVPDEGGWEDPSRQNTVVLAPQATRAIVESVARTPRPS